MLINAPHCHDTVAAHESGCGGAECKPLRRGKRGKRSNFICSGIEVVITGLTRNQFAGNRTWVRIPPAAPARRKRHIACDELFHFIAKLIARSFCCSSLPNRTRCRWAPVWVRRCAAVLSYRKEVSILPVPSSPPQATYRLRRAFSFHCKAHRALILLLLATKPDPLSLGSGLECRPAGGSGFRNTHLFGARGLLARSTLRDSNARQK